MTTKRKIYGNNGGDPKRPVDGLRAWVIAFDNFLINFIVVGLGRMSGVLYIVFMKMFHINRQAASMPFSIQQATRAFFGPLAGIVGQKYGIRCVTIIGGIIGAVSATACYFVMDITWITVLWGFMFGVCTALTTTLNQVPIDQYFEKHRTTAGGLAFSGGCVATFIFPLMLESLISSYGMARTFLFLGALIFLVIPAATLLVKPPWCKKCNRNTEYLESEIVRLFSLTMEGKSKRHSFAHKLKNLAETDRKALLSYFPTTMHSEVLKVVEKMDDCSSEPEEDENSLLQHVKTAIKLHKNPIFVLVCLCRGVFMLTFIPLVTVIVDFAMDKGLRQSTGKYLIPVLSLGDLLGRLCLGWINDSGLISLPKYMLVAMLLLACSTATLPLMQGELSLIPAILIFGMLEGSLFIRHQNLISMYTEEHEQAIGMGFINFLSGFIGFALPFYIGYFRDVRGSYDGMFYLNAGICAFIGVFWIFEPFFMRISSKSKYKKITEA